MPNYVNKPYFVAGGLGPDNIENVANELNVAEVYPYGFDIETGVEGSSKIFRTNQNIYVKVRKDPIKMGTLCAAAYNLKSNRLFKSDDYELGKTLT